MHVNQPWSTIDQWCLFVLCIQLMSAVGETQVDAKPPADTLVVRSIIILCTHIPQSLVIGFIVQFVMALLLLSTKKLIDTHFIIHTVMVYSSVDSDPCFTRSSLCL